MKKPKENKRYCFTITETLRKNVTIMAPFEDIARKRLMDKYNKENIVLSADDFVEMKIKRAR